MAILFKGQTNEKEQVSIKLLFHSIFADEIEFPLDKITITYLSKEEVAFHYNSFTLRILSTDLYFDEIYKRLSRRNKTLVFVSLTALFSLVICFLTVFSFTDEIANSIPDKYFNRIIESNNFLENFGDSYCKVNDGLNHEILETLNIKESYQLYLLDIELKNAFAFPTQKIIFTRELLEVLNDEEFFAILGHEIGHLHFKHYKPAVLRSLFLDLLGVGLSSSLFKYLGGFTSTKHSRDAERESDQRSVELMKQSKISLSNNINAMKKISEDRAENKYFSFISTHPLTSERIDFFKQEQEKNFPIKVSNSRDLVSELIKTCKKSLNKI